MSEYRVSWKAYFKRIGVSLIATLVSLLYFIYLLLNKDWKMAAIVFVFLVFVFAIESAINFFVIDHLILSSVELKYQYILSSKIERIELNKVSHFCYFDRPINKPRNMPYLEIYLNAHSENINKVRLELCFSIIDRYLFLSRLHRLGFQVTLFESLKEIQNSEFYIEE